MLLSGDVGTFTADCPPDKATVRQAAENPCELEFLAWSDGTRPRWLDGIFAPTAEGGLGMTAPVIMVTGNHEGFEWIELLLSELPIDPPEEPVELGPFRRSARGNASGCCLPGGASRRRREGSSPGSAASSPASASAPGTRTPPTSSPPPSER